MKSQKSWRSPTNQGTTQLPPPPPSTPPSGRLATLVRPSPTGLRPAARITHGKYSRAPTRVPRCATCSYGRGRLPRLPTSLPPRLPDRTSGLRLKMQGGVSGFRKPLPPPRSPEFCVSRSSCLYNFSDRGGAGAVFPFGSRERAGDAGGRPRERPPVRRLQRAAPRPRPRHLIPGGPNLAGFCSVCCACG